MARVQLSTDINRLVLLTEPVVFCDNPNSDGLELRLGDSRGYNVLIDIVIIGSSSPILGNTASESCIQAWESGRAAETTCKLDGTVVNLETWSIMTLGEREVELAGVGVVQMCPVPSLYVVTITSEMLPCCLSPLILNRSSMYLVLFLVSLWCSERLAIGMASMLSNSKCSVKRVTSDDSPRFPAVLVPVALF